jgi:hypothetical protein
MDDALERRWLSLASDLGLATEGLRGLSTRGEFVRRAFALKSDNK